MAGPLALLGDAIASGMAENAAIRREAALHARTRAERQADIAEARQHERALIGDARKFEKDQRDSAWRREDALYKERRYDAIKDQLVKDGLLDIADVSNPDAVAAALQKSGREYQRAIQELAEYKASVPSIIAATKGKASGIQSILSMTPADIGQARQLMQGAYGVLEEAVKTDTDRKELNAQNGAAMMMAHVGKLTALDARKAKLEDEFERLTSGELTPNEIARIRQGAAAKAGITKPEVQWTPSDREAFRAKEAEQEQEYRMFARHQLQQQARSLDNETRNINSQYEGVKAAIQTGAAAYMTPGSTAPAALSAEPTAPATPTAASAVAPGAGTSEFVASLGGGPAAIPAPTAGPAAPPLIKFPAPQQPPGFGGDPLAGLAFSAGNKVASALGTVAGYLGNAPLAGLNSLPAEIRDTAAREERIAEDRVLASEPYSERAAAIRQKRGVPPLINIPALSGP